MKFKKFLLPLLTLGLMTMATACSDSDEPAAKMPEQVGNGETETITFTCKLPSGLRSRGADENGFFGDGKEATQLTAAVYDRDYLGNLKHRSTSRATANADGTFTISLPTSKGNNTEIFFWADAWGSDTRSPFSFDWENTTVTVDYEKSLKMFDKADAFCYLWESSEYDTNVTLTRPFAQINILSDELAYASYNLLGTGFALGHNREGLVLPNSLNFMTGEINYTDLISLVPLPNFESPNFHAQGYPEESKYCYMGYIFAPSERAIWNQEVESFKMYFCDTDVTSEDSFSEIQLDYNFPVKANDQVIIYRMEQSPDNWLSENTKFYVQVNSVFDNNHSGENYYGNEGQDPNNGFFVQK